MATLNVHNGGEKGNYTDYDQCRINNVENEFNVIIAIKDLHGFAPKYLTIKGITLEELKVNVLNHNNRYSGHIEYLNGHDVHGTSTD